MIEFNCRIKTATSLHDHPTSSLVCLSAEDTVRIYNSTHTMVIEGLPLIGVPFNQDHYFLLVGHALCSL